MRFLGACIFFVDGIRGAHYDVCMRRAAMMRPSTGDDTMATETPRAHVHIPGFEFMGYGEGYLLPMFGQGIKIDVYRKLGGITAEVRNMVKQQISANPDDPHKWHIMTSKDHGHTNAYIRAS